MARIWCLWLETQSASHSPGAGRRKSRAPPFLLRLQFKRILGRGRINHRLVTIASAQGCLTPPCIDDLDIHLVRIFETNAELAVLQTILHHLPTLYGIFRSQLPDLKKKS